MLRQRHRLRSHETGRIRDRTQIRPVTAVHTIYFKPFTRALRETNTESDTESDEADDIMRENEEEGRDEEDERPGEGDDGVDRRERRYPVRRRRER